MTPYAAFIRAMPKVELHIHLEGAIQPETVLALAQKHHKPLPAQTVDELRTWYRFTDFAHFVEVYLAISDCIRTIDDLEFVAREFLAAQAAHHIRYTEVTFTALTHYHFKGLAWEDQLGALLRARQWAEATHGISMGIILDIPRSMPAHKGMLVAEWAVGAMDRGVVALGLGGPERGNPPEKFREAFAHAHAAGLPAVPHAGETDGPASIWGALETLHARRIGHGVRCLEDPALVDELRARQIPLEVCPTSNICLGVVPSWQAHPLPRLLDAGLCITLNSDDPPMFNTTLTDEYLMATQTFGWDCDQIEQIVLNGVRASLLPTPVRHEMERSFRTEFDHLRNTTL